LVLDAEATRLVPGHHVDLLEGALVQQQVDALSRRQLPRFVLSCDGTLAPGMERFVTQLPEFFDPCLGTHGAPV
jgi:hypothetical protein